MSLQCKWSSGSHLSFRALELAVAVDEIGAQDLRHSLVVLRVIQAHPVELALGLARLSVHLGQNGLNQVNLRAEEEEGRQRR